MPSELYSIPFKTITGEPTSLAGYKDKVLLIVNVATECGRTPQYAGLENLYEKYKDKGLVVIGFPANNFDNQEPGTNEEIMEFCKTHYGVQFPMMSKISVKGDDIHPLYNYLTTHAEPPGEVMWNFDKFLIDREGNIAKFYNIKIQPEDPEIVNKIEELLK